VGSWKVWAGGSIEAARAMVGDAVCAEAGAQRQKMMMRIVRRCGDVMEIGSRPATLN
jgi:hypothetical protein